MGCRSDYLEPTAREQESVRVMKFLQEFEALENEKIGIYGSIENLDWHTQLLCKLCQELEPSKKSLELQIWWRDHQKADKDRIQLDLKNAKRLEDKAKVLNRLTSYEKELLGL